MKVWSAFLLHQKPFTFHSHAQTKRTAVCPSHSGRYRCEELRKKRRTLNSISIATKRTETVSLSASRAKDEHDPERYGFTHVATVTGAHGVHGGVKVTSVSDFSEYRLSGENENPNPRFLKLKHRRYPRPISIRYCKRTSKEDVWIVFIKGIETRDDFQTFQLQGARIYVRSQDKPPLARGEFVVADLMDLRVALISTDETDQHVYQTSTRNRGTITASHIIGVIETVIDRSQICKDESAAKVANDILQIALFDHPQLHEAEKFTDEIPEDATRVLVPFVKQIVPIVDLSQSLVVVDPPSGLLDITVVNDITKPKAPRGLLMAASD